MQNRPGIISFIGYLLILGAAFGGIAGVMLIATQNDTGVQESTGASPNELLIAGIVALVIAGVQLLIAIALLRGSRVARALIAAVQIIHVMSAAWLMFTHHDGTFLYGGLTTVAVAIFVLWALFNERADQYYNTGGQGAAIR